MEQSHGLHGYLQCLATQWQFQKATILLIGGMAPRSICGLTGIFSLMSKFGGGSSVLTSSSPTRTELQATGFRFLFITLPPIRYIPQWPKKYYKLPLNQKGGVTYLFLALCKMFQMSQEVKLAMLKFLDVFMHNGVSRYTPENVLVVSEELLGGCKDLDVVKA